MKGLVLSGGVGSRLRPITFTRAKQLIPIANKPVLFYGIEDLVEAGIRSIGVIVNPDTAGEVREALGDGSRWGANFVFIPQEAPLGLAHAVRTAGEFLGNDPFVMYLGDNLLSGGITHLVEEYRDGEHAAVILLTRVENPREFGVAELGPDGRVVRLVEKPEDPPSDLALVGIYLFSPLIHGIIEALKPSWRGEYEITDALQGLIDTGHCVRALLVQGWWKDTGKAEDLLDANRLVLSGCPRRIEGAVEESEIVGAVIVESGARVVRSVIRGPAHIAEGTVIDRSYVGPYTSIGRHVRVQNSAVEHSIVLDGAEVRDTPYTIDASIIGQGAIVCGNQAEPRRHIMRLVLGDRSRVQI